MSKKSARAKIGDYLVEHLGEVVTHEELQQVSGISEWARRVRELRDEFGWQILSNNDSDALKPGEYLLATLPSQEPVLARQRGMSQKLRAEVLDRDGSTCQMCGVAAGELDPETRRPVRLHIGHIVDKSLGGEDVSSNLRTLCSTCNQGAKNITPEKPKLVWLLSQVRKAPMDDQRALLEWLKSRFND